MTYVVDTDILSYFLRSSSEKVVERIGSAGFNTIGVTAITVAEMLYGLKTKYGSVDEKVKTVERLFSKLRIYPFDLDAAKKFAEIKASLKKSGVLMHDFDLMIASICIVNETRLVTHNTKHFRRIRGLKIEDWMK